MEEHAYHKQLPSTIPGEAIYADDDLRLHLQNQQVKVNKKSKIILLENIKVNETKTEDTVLERKTK